MTYQAAVPKERQATIGELQLALLALQDEVKALRRHIQLQDLAIKAALTTLADLKEAKK